MPTQGVDQVGAAEEYPGLRPPEELVAAGRHEIGPGSQRSLRIGFPREDGVPRQQAGPDIDDDRYP